MTPKRNTRWLAIVTLLAAKAPVSAQEIRVSYVGAYAGHERIRAIDGFDVQITSARRRATAANVWYRRLSGLNDREGSTCVGLIPPGSNCSIEPIRDRSTLDEVGLALDVSAFSRSFPGATIESSGRFGGQAAWVKSHSRGALTGNGLGDEVRLLGMNAAFDVTVRRRPTSRLGLHFGVGGAVFSGTRATKIDGDNPFTQGFTVSRIELGVLWRTPQSTSTP